MCETMWPTRPRAYARRRATASDCSGVGKAVHSPEQSGLCHNHGLRRAMEDLARYICDLAKRRGAAFADVRILHRQSESILVQDGKADKLSTYTDRGIGVRVLIGRCWGFASADSLLRRRGERCLSDALALAKASEPFVSDPAMMAAVTPVQAEDIRQPEIPPNAMPVKEKTARLLEYERAGRKAGGDAIVNSVVSYSDGQREELLANTAGTLVRTAVSRAVATCLLVASNGRILQRGTEYRGIAGGAELLRRTTPEEFSIRAAEKALSLLKARPAPAGRFTVIFHPSITGLLVHEALGHNAEADAVWAGQSILEGRLAKNSPPKAFRSMTIRRSPAPSARTPTIPRARRASAG